MAIGRDFGDILRAQGYIPDNELGIMADVRYALAHYRQPQIKAREDFVIANIDLHMINMGVLPAVKPQHEINQLRDLTFAAKERAAARGKKQTILVVTNNGGAHLVVTEISIETNGVATIRVVDSKAQSNSPYNNVIMNHALEAARDAHCVNPTGQVVYRGVQGHDANCPFWVMNHIAQRVENGVVANQPLTSNNIHIVKEAALKNIIQVKRDADVRFPLQPADVAIDAEFGTAYVDTDAGRRGLAQYKAQRHAAAGHVVAATSAIDNSWMNTVRAGALAAITKREAEQEAKQTGEKAIEYRPGFFVTERTQIAADKQLASATSHLSDEAVRQLTTGFKR